MMIDSGEIVSVGAFANRFGVSHETNRRDIRNLEEAGRLRRIHGGAAPALHLDRTAYRPVTERLTVDAEAKVAAARAALALFQLDGGAQIISKRAFQAAPSFAAREIAPVGTGPFKVKDFAYDRRFVFAAHDGYWGGRPTIDELEFRIVPELASRLNQLATDEAQVITEVSPDQFLTIAAMTGREVAGGAIQNLHGINYNAFDPALAGPRVCRALFCAIDRQANAQGLLAALPPPDGTRRRLSPIGALAADDTAQLRRVVAFPGLSDNATARLGGHSVQGFGEAGYRIGLSEAVALEPFAGGAVVSVTRERFEERGGAAALTGFGYDHAVPSATMGLRMQAQLDRDVPAPAFVHGMVAYRRSFGDLVSSVPLAFRGTGARFASRGLPLDRDTLVSEVGLGLMLAPGLSAGLSYTGQIGARAQDHAAKGTLVYKF